MSLVSIAGGATGTGTFTVLAPSTNTNRTLTLPDSTGTMATAESTLVQFNASGSAPVYAARAWVNFNGTGTPAIRGSGNVSSITDGGTGDYIVNFATAMPDENYSWALSGALTNSITVTGRAEATAPTTTEFRLGTFNAAGVPGDPSFVNAAFFR